ncbi:glycine zipper 2TM domain-containing protein [Malikia sp.]|uniref:glycine zipper 2TM domain-containing protein n=1 Tax=Malikia sp. TaxID=2070706 RepID=UPI0026349AE0|nr:glycine zipper 2TM domain-containing protein [Malikia sp.]MDD2729399.1 glycine zipper 2TM domain-containing protein [Malikia sp.]
MNKSLISWAVAALALGNVGLAQAEGLPEGALTPKAQYAADAQAAQSRYKSDLKLCADEPESTGRMQCKRDAKAEYEQALTDAKWRQDSAGKVAPAQTFKPKALCADCGKVSSVQLLDRAGEGSAVGMIAGGAAGALLGRQVGAGLGKDLATLAGAAGGAYAGKQLEQRMKTQKVWDVTVAYPGGDTLHYEFTQDPGLQVGDVVRKSELSIVRY